MPAEFREVGSGVYDWQGLGAGHLVRFLDSAMTLQIGNITGPNGGPVAIPAALSGVAPAGAGYTWTGSKPATANSGISAGTFFTVTAPNGGDALSGTVAGGAGGAITLTTGAGGLPSGVIRGGIGGALTVNLGAGGTSSSGAPTAGDFVINAGLSGGGTGRASRLRFLNSSVNSGTGASVTLNEYGIGITNGYAGDTAAASGVPVNIQTLITDPVGNQAGAQHLMTLAATGANAAGGNAGNFTIYTSTTNNNFTGTWAPLDVEVYMQGAAGATYTGLTAITALPHTETTSGANVTNFKAVTGSPTHQGTGTITTCIAFDSAITNSGTGGASDGAITTAIGFRSGFTFNGTAASAGNTTTLTGFQQLAAIFGPGATHQLTNVNGLLVSPQINTLGGTSTTGGFTTNGVQITLGTQGGNTSGTTTHKGLYVTGNGGVAGGGGTVTNWAIFSDSTAASSLAGKLTVAYTSADPGATDQGLSVTTTETLTGTNSQANYGILGVWQSGTDTNTYTSGSGNVAIRATATYRGLTAGSVANLLGVLATAQTNTTTTGAITNAWGVQSNIGHNGTGVVTSAYGVYGRVQLLTSGTSVDGNISTAYALWGRVINTANAATPGVITTGYGLYIEAPSVSSSSTAITTIYGARIINQGTSSSTTALGLAVAVQSGATTNAAIVIGANPGSGSWGVFSNTSNVSAFNGSMVIGSTTAPAASTFQVASGYGTVLGGGLTLNYRTASTTDAIGVNDCLLIYTGGPFTATLPTAVGVTGKVYMVKAPTGGTNNITIATTSAQTIDGAATLVLNANNEAALLISDGANWKVMSDAATTIL